jgi:hypothetical protein
MVRKERRPKRFWSKRRIAAVTVIIVLALFIVANAILLYHPPSPHPPIIQLGFPMEFVAPHNLIPTGNFSINRTAVSQFVNYTLVDYNNLLASPSGQENWANFTTIQHYFDLYRPSGGWEVLVASDNGTVGTKYNGWLEFMFIPKPAQDASPKVVVFTNESAPSVRPALGTANGSNSVSIDRHLTKYGIILAHYYTTSSLGEGYIPLDWITNSSSVYGDVATNANNAALTIYHYDVQVMHAQLYPPYPHWGWFQNEWRWYGGTVEFTALVLTLVTSVLYLREKGYLQVKATSGTEREEQPKETRT